MKDFILKILDECYEVFSKQNGQMKILNGKYKLYGLGVAVRAQIIFLIFWSAMPKKKDFLMWLIKTKAEVQQEKLWLDKKKRFVMGLLEFLIEELLKTT